MNKGDFQNSIFTALTDKGYIAVVKINGEPYDGKDMYFCVQAPELYKLSITPNYTRIEKNTTNGYIADCSTQVKSVDDIELLHEELNNLIINLDESSLKNKYKSGCFL